ncbi:PTS system N-acetylglucosamine-specific IIB component, Glc family (TC 4.A.1.1.7)/PTS system N-acetylglucosamine-specific IIC component, Glc family (TC 4.A.1.1.7) [Lentibacillus halodurans]|uniref:PTS system N-acetylglucosamine-specific IIB component, Glc family (TC 4.A.1.1.7)/PTS system N-acetylglucosamine-specific IIC component, Glc family (TC 4.A.1.1.7) n=1 Tax=Lentibacillus halodurans TaxID=237679 RepID=A0A1I0XJL7_9BACI|nr:PTS transporter subunit EIIC [Lentibacillus halodurans]SFB00418.1 PTS system N-acetylglucosamine-specific IIB component, Glc family (TC 4.A.1.1.7)/PTS system N-acetylglucosamine-specific IIC component, Glc family (TC 4.A.1.1.7) [Lentibacillus halodurans]
MRRFMQNLGKSMLIPIVALPAAGILFRISAEDLLDWPLVQGAGAIFNNMDILISIGIAMGLAKTKDRGIPALTGFLAIAILNEGLATINPDLDMSVFGGVLSGLIAAFIYNRFKDTRLPNIFSFFGGEKFPITMIIVTMIPVTGISVLLWPYAQSAIDSLAQGLVGLGAAGIFIFGFLNRFLLPFGLHHVLNTYIYFGLGSYETAGGEVVTGEITRFLNGDPTAGYFLGGFFVVMIFGIPAIALAITRAAYKKKKEETKALMSSGSLTSVVAGLTEPIEFTFLFTSPLLYFIHSVYTGLAGATLYLLNVRHGFSWGGSAIDYTLNLGIADSGWMIIPVGLAFGVLYYFTFYTIIVKKNIKVVGREDDTAFSEEREEHEKDLELSHGKYEYMAKKILQNVGGKENLVDYENCMTRLRLVVKDASKVDEEKIKQTGAHGIVKVDHEHVQIVIGPEVSHVYQAFRKQVEE